VHETWVTVNSITETIQEIRSVVLAVSESLDNLPPSIMSMIGRNYFSETLSSLNSTFYNSGEMIAQMDHLSATLEPMEEVLDEVAAGVDTLAGDLFDTEAAFGEATEHLDRAASAIRTAAGSSVLQIAIAATGLIPILVGIYLIIQAVALGRLYSSAGKASEGEAPDESMDYIDTDTSAE